MWWLRDILDFRKSDICLYTVDGFDCSYSKCRLKVRYCIYRSWDYSNSPVGVPSCLTPGRYRITIERSHESGWSLPLTQFLQRDMIRKVVGNQARNGEVKMGLKAWTKSVTSKSALYKVGRSQKRVTVCSWNSYLQLYRKLAALLLFIGWNWDSEIDYAVGWWSALADVDPYIESRSDLKPGVILPLSNCLHVC